MRGLSRSGALNRPGGDLWGAKIRIVAATASLILCAASSPLCSETHLFYQLSTGTFFPLKTDYLPESWRQGPSLAGEIGCHVGRYFAPAIGLSYTRLSLNWDEVEVVSRPDYAQRRVREGHSYMVTSSFLLKLSDFADESLLRHHLVIGASFVLRRMNHLRRDWYDPLDGTTPVTLGPPRTETDLFLGAGTGLQFGSAGSASIYAEAMFMVTVDMEGVISPIEIGLEF